MILRDSRGDYQAAIGDDGRVTIDGTSVTSSQRSFNHNDNPSTSTANDK